jgi:hypothetical protein
MPYIGKTPLTGAYQLCDTITTSATATYNLTVGSSPVIPGAAQNCIVSLNGVIQAPVSAYTVSGSTIVFSSTLSATDVIDFILILGNVFDIGTPTNGTVTPSSIQGGTSGLFTWQSVQTTGFTAVAGRAYPCNTTSASFTVTLPATPSVGNQVLLLDYAGTADTNTIVINPNGNKVEGSTINFELTGEREGVILTYIDSTQGWLATSGINEGTDALQPVPYSVDFLVVAGGGGGGNQYGGGGGAGGYRTSTQTVNAATVITVTVGDGGAGDTNGSNSSISGSGLTTITSAGGGSGIANAAGASGGSGGGGGVPGGGTTAAGSGNTPSTSPSQGNNGGGGGRLGGGGGGGANAVGGTFSGNTGGDGGAGTASSITGSSVTRAGGGGGMGWNVGGTGGAGGGGNGGVLSTTAGGNGTVNTGGGGGGVGSANGGIGGSGGKGVVILSVPTARYSSTTTGSPTVTTSGSNTILQFNGSGSYTT